MRRWTLVRRIVMSGGLASLVVIPTVSCRSPHRGALDSEVGSGEWLEIRKPKHQPAALPGPEAAVPAFSSEERAPAGALVVDLARVLELAGSQATEVALAREGAAVAAADEEQARALFLPILRPGVRINRIEGRVQDTGGEFIEVAKQNLFYGAGIELSVALGEAWYRSHAAEARTRAKLAELCATEHDTLREASRRYYDLVEAQAAIVIAEAARAQADELVRFEQAREGRGRGLEADVRQAEARLAETERELASAHQRTRLASSRLATLLMLDGQIELWADEGPIHAVSFGMADHPAGELVDRALSRRPEIKAAQARLEAAHEVETGGDRGWLIPRVRAGVSYGGFGPTLGDTSDQEAYYAGLEWTIGFGQAALSRRGKALRRGDELRLQAVRRQVTAEVIEARDGVTASRSLIAAARREVEAASAALEVTEARLREGASLMVEVLQAQVTFSKARAALVSAIVRHNQAQYDLLRAVGGP